MRETGAEGESAQLSQEGVAIFNQRQILDFSVLIFNEYLFGHVSIENEASFKWIASLFMLSLPELFRCCQEVPVD